MYDASELDEWIEDATISGDERDRVDHEEVERQNRENNRRRRRN
jgi:hypothetical protein